MFCDPPRSNRHVQTGIFKPPLLAKSTGEGLGSAWLCKRMIHLLIKPKNKEALSISWGSSMRGSDPKLSNEQLGLDLRVPPRMEPGPVGDGEGWGRGSDGCGRGRWAPGTPQPWQQCVRWGQLEESALQRY